MTVDIHEPELEALILDRMKRGTFESVEQVLIHALKSAPLPAVTRDAVLTSADLIAAMQSSPHKDVDLQPSRSASPIREVSI